MVVHWPLLTQKTVKVRCYSQDISDCKFDWKKKEYNGLNAKIAKK